MLIVALNRKPTKKEEFPYKKKDYLLTKAEKEFFNVLKQATDQKNLLLFSKVRLEDLLWLPKGLDRGERFGLRNRVKSRHVDFVVCDKENVKPLLVIELDDSSHLRLDRKVRDSFLDQILHGAGLKIVHIKTASSYDLSFISDRIN